MKTACNELWIFSYLSNQYWSTRQSQLGTSLFRRQTWDRNLTQSDHSSPCWRLRLIRDKTKLAKLLVVLCQVSSCVVKSSVIPSKCLKWTWQRILAFGKSVSVWSVWVKKKWVKWKKRKKSALEKRRTPQSKLWIMFALRDLVDMLGMESGIQTAGLTLCIHSTQIV